MRVVTSSDNTKNNGDTPSDSVEVLRDFAHEIRNPLTAVFGFTQRLEAEAAATTLTPEQAAEYARIIHTASVQMLNICERVLAGAVEDDQHPSLSPVDAREIGEELIALFGEAAKKAGVSLKMSVPVDFPKIMSEPIMLRQILTNVLGNAIKFTPAGGSVELRAKILPDQKAALLVVQDTGTGIPSDVLLRLQNGQQIPTSSPRGDKGFGRGLQIATQLARQLSTTLEIHVGANGGTVAAIRHDIAE